MTLRAHYWKVCPRIVPHTQTRVLNMMQAVLDAGYQEDHLTSNVKISVGSIT